MIDYFIPTISIPYFIINQTTGMIQRIQEITNFDLTLFPIRFQVFAQDRGIPPLRSVETVDVTIYYDYSTSPPVAQWIGQSYENIQMSISEKFFELNFTKSITQSSSSFNGSYFYRLASNITLEMILKNPFNESIPFRTGLLSSNNHLYSSGIYVTRLTK